MTAAVILEVISMMFRIVSFRDYHRGEEDSVKFWLFVGGILSFIASIIFFVNLGFIESTLLFFVFCLLYYIPLSKL